MKITDMNWMQVEAYLEHDDRCVLPLGSVEQHAYLSLAVDSILSQKIAVDAAEPLGIPVFPVLYYGLAPHWTAFPGSVTLRIETYVQLVRDLLNSFAKSGFKRILVVNGHGGNMPAAGVVNEMTMVYPEVKVKFHNWWNAPKTWAKVTEIDPDGSHASWMENFPWTRLEGLDVPDKKKPMADFSYFTMLNPEEKRAYSGDGNMGGVYQRSDEDMLAVWDVAVEETRTLLESWRE
jgi:creatinine amidohydrolase